MPARWSKKTAALAIALGVGLGAAGLLVGTAITDEREDVAPIVIDAHAGDSRRAVKPPSRRESSETTERREEIVVNDGIPVADARRAAAVAEQRARGDAVTVDRDDGLYEVEIQRPDGPIIDVYVDKRFRMIGIDREDAGQFD